jgi:hypothetical protein
VMNIRDDDRLVAVALVVESGTAVPDEDIAASAPAAADAG